MSLGSAVYIGTDGGGPGGQWVRYVEGYNQVVIKWYLLRTRSGWRLSESENEEIEEPTKDQVQDILGKHIKKTSNKIIMVEAEGIKGAPRK